MIPQGTLTDSLLHTDSAYSPIESGLVNVKPQVDTISVRNCMWLLVTETPKIMTQTQRWFLSIRENQRRQVRAGVTTQQNLQGLRHLLSSCSTSQFSALSSRSPRCPGWLIGALDSYQLPRWWQEQVSSLPFQKASWKSHRTLCPSPVSQNLLTRPHLP